MKVRVKKSECFNKVLTFFMCVVLKIVDNCSQKWVM